jgi:hypothetical protein
MLHNTELREICNIFDSAPGIKFDLIDFPFNFSFFLTKGHRFAEKYIFIYKNTFKKLFD